MKVVRSSVLRTGRLYHSGNIPSTHFCYRLSQPQGHSAAGNIMSMKNSNDTIGNRTRDLPACSSVSQPTAPPRDLRDRVVFWFSEGETSRNKYSAWTIWPSKIKTPLSLEMSESDLRVPTSTALCPRRKESSATPLRKSLEKQELLMFRFLWW
jgi:hypothetical protein